MSDAELDRNNLELAMRCIEQVKQCVQDVRARLDADPANAPEFIRPSSCLMEKLLEAQGEVQGLIDDINLAERLCMYVSR